MWDNEIYENLLYFGKDGDELTREDLLDYLVLKAREALPPIRLEYSDLTESEKARIKDSFAKTIPINSNVIKYPISREDRNMLID
jgi:hypothetical protein